MAQKTGEPSPLLDVGFQPNQLDQFDLPTYHFRLFMMSDDAVRKRHFGTSSREHRIVIAESGVTAIDIDNVEIHSVVGPSKGAGIGLSTQFSFTLTQPFGATLLDEIANAAYQLGIQNYSKAPYFLELSFRSPSIAGETDALAESNFNNLIWVWPLIFTKMSMDVNVGGSTYQIEANLYGDMAHTNEISDLEQAISINAETVGEFFTQFEEVLNERERQKKETSSYQLADTYAFHIDPKIFDEKIVPESREDRQNRAATFERVDNKMRIGFQPGTSIDRVIHNILSVTKFFQNKAKGTDKSDDIKKANQGEDAIFQTIYRVTADSEMGGYDKTRQDYQRLNKYLLAPLETTTTQTQSNNEANVTDQQRFDAIRRKGRLTKRYDYIFTGLNDQVLDFDLVFNFNWYAALPLQGGIHNIPVNAEDGAVKTDRKKLIEAGGKIISDKDKAIEDTFNALSTEVLGSFSPFSILDKAKSLLPQNVVELQESVQSVNIDQLQAGDIIGTVTDNIGAPQFGIEGVGDSIGGLPDLGPLVSNLPLGASTIARFDSPFDRILNMTDLGRLSTGNTNSVADAQQNLRAVDYKLDDQVIGEKSINPLIVSYIEATPGKGQSDTNSYSETPGQTMLSALFEQAESPVSADLLSIDLKIKGDPYWLEPLPIGRGTRPLTRLDRALADRDANDPDTNAVTDVGEQQSFNGVNTTDAQTYFLFRSFTPQTFDATTGITPKNNKDRNVLNGIYGVRTVVHTFSSGQFTQELNAIRDPQLNLQGVDLDAPADLASVAPDTDSIVSDVDPTDPFSFSTGSTTLGLDAFERKSASALPIDGLQVGIDGTIGGADRSSGDLDG